MRLLAGMPGSDLVSPLLQMRIFHKCISKLEVPVCYRPSGSASGSSWLSCR